MVHQRWRLLLVASTSLMSGHLNLQGEAVSIPSERRLKEYLGNHALVVVAWYDDRSMDRATIKALKKRLKQVSECYPFPEACVKFVHINRHSFEGANSPVHSSFTEPIYDVLQEGKPVARATLPQLLTHFKRRRTKARTCSACDNPDVYAVAQFATKHLQRPIDVRLRATLRRKTRIPGCWDASRNPPHWQGYGGPYVGYGYQIPPGNLQFYADVPSNASFYAWGYRYW